MLNGFGFAEFTVLLWVCLLVGFGVLVWVGFTCGLLDCLWFDWYGLVVGYCWWRLFIGWVGLFSLLGFAGFVVSWVIYVVLVIALWDCFFIVCVGHVSDLLFAWGVVVFDYAFVIVVLCYVCDFVYFFYNYYFGFICGVGLLFSGVWVGFWLRFGVSLFRGNLLADRG